jgi:hypothetical protein
MVTSEEDDGLCMDHPMYLVNLFLQVGLSSE